MAGVLHATQSSTHPGIMNDIRRSEERYNPPSLEQLCFGGTRIDNARALEQALRLLHHAAAAGRSCGTRVRCTGLNSPTLPHDRVTCALHTRRGTTHSPLVLPCTGASAEAASSCRRGWQILVHECIAQVSTAQRRPTITSPVRCTPAAVPPIHLWYARALEQTLNCCVVPPRLAEPCGARVRCTGLNSPTLPHDHLTCALHTRRGATHSRKPA